jgi:hypothetical protein
MFRLALILAAALALTACDKSFAPGTAGDAARQGTRCSEGEEGELARETSARSCSTS